MKPLTSIISNTVVIPNCDIDTDQIIPARFLTTTSREGLGKHLFSEWRFDASGQLKSDFVLNQPASQGCQILVAGDNFGCGSSREHAPWALLDYGFKAVISTSMADIFRSNSLKNGLIPVVVEPDVHQWLVRNPGANLTIDLDQCVVSIPEHADVRFLIDSFSRYCLIHGVDELGYLLGKMADIEAYEGSHVA